MHCFFFFQAEDGIRDPLVTGVQTCALPIWETAHPIFAPNAGRTQTIGNPIVVLPDGTVVDVFNYIRGSNGGGIQRGDNAAVSFSTDQGTTWSSTPTIIANMGDRGVRDPEPVNCLGDNTPSTPCLLVRTG